MRKHQFQAHADCGQPVVDYGRVVTGVAFNATVAGS